MHHAVRARLAIERGRSRQAEYWIGDLRNLALSLACLRRGLEPEYGRGLDGLPEEVLARCDEARPLSVDRADLLRALVHAVDALLHEGAAHPAAANVRLWLGELAAPTLG